MKPAGPLMIEHRLIERMIHLMERHVVAMEKGGRVDERFLDTAVDFIRTYADRCHHGKEEDILFRDLAKKPLSDAHRRQMADLVEEHVYARKTVGLMLAAEARYLRGDREAFAQVLACIRELLVFYPGHIRKEDREFFPAAMGYLDASEQAAMLEEFREFDRLLIHGHYQQVVGDLEAAEGEAPG